MEPFCKDCIIIAMCKRSETCENFNKKIAPFTLEQINQHIVSHTSNKTCPMCGNEIKYEGSDEFRGQYKCTLCKFQIYCDGIRY
jgi:transposase-like protein